MSNLFWGKVKRGKGRGERLGFPTANVRLHQNILQGIYISQAKLNGVWKPSLTFIGKAETFGDCLFQSETYILALRQTLYDKWISIHLVKKIRENKKFASQEELIAAMKQDEKKAQEYFSKKQYV